MATSYIQPRSLEERLVFWTIVGTWGFWSIGALYIVAPALGWSLAAIAVLRWLGVVEPSPWDLRGITLNTAVWFVSMLVMAVGLIIAHLQFDLGAALTLKSFIGWMKGWALLAVFAFVGAALSIRAQIVYRASGFLALQTIAIAPILVLGAVAQLPHPLYVSPLQIVGGPGPEYFSVSLYGIEPETGGWRWSFFSPWAPAAAMTANFGFLFALFEKHRFLKAAGIVATLLVCVMTQSRLGLICIPVLMLSMLALGNLTRPIVFGIGGILCALAVPFWETLNTFAQFATDRFVNARASSSRVRSILQSIAVHRWENEAPVWGHGTVERGSHLVEYMPIGSHHTWFGLLYVKGMVGFLALALPLAWSFLEMLAKSQTDRTARCALGVLVILLMYSFGENLEILSYLFWPGMLIIGIASRHRLVQPYHRFLGRAIATAPLSLRSAPTSAGPTSLPATHQ